MSDIENLTKLIHEKFNETNNKIESIQSSLSTDLATVHTSLEQHDSRIKAIENENITKANEIDTIKAELEILKQDRLRNNIRLTGLPPMGFDDPMATVLAIDRILNLGLLPTDISVYADRHKSSLIVSFASYSLKRSYMNALQQRRSLLVEEVFPSIQSQSNIYANDQLTPYFANLFQLAWKAKKDGKLFSASSLGGRIKVKRSENSSFAIIVMQKQLDEILNDELHNDAQPPASGSSTARNGNNNTFDNRNNSNNNNSFNTSNVNNNSTSNTTCKGPQPATTNPSLRNYLDRKQSHRYENRSSINQFKLRNRDEFHKHRANSRDRTYRGAIDFNESPPPPSNQHRSDNRYSSNRRSRSPSNHRYHSRNRYNRDRY